MKIATKTRQAHAAKRELFAELSEGVAALKAARLGKRILRTRLNTSWLVGAK